MTKHFPEPWNACHDGECQCKQIWSTPADCIVGTVEAGDTGDDYPAVRIKEPLSIGAVAEAYMEQLTYWHIPEEVARANIQRIVACVNACAGIDNPEKVIPTLLPGRYIIPYNRRLFESRRYKKPHRDEEDKLSKLFGGRDET